MTNLYPILRCRGCREPIELPRPNLPEKQPHQSVWPADAWTQTFGCRKCGQVYRYTAQDVQFRHGLTLARTPQGVDETGFPPFVFCVEVKLGEGKRETQERIHSSWSEWPPKKEAEEILAKWKSHIEDSNALPVKDVSAFEKSLDWWK